MDGTLKFVNYKAGDTQNLNLKWGWLLKTTIALLKPNIFLILFVKILSYAYKIGLQKSSGHKGVNSSGHLG